MRAQPTFEAQTVTVAEPALIPFRTIWLPVTDAETTEELVLFETVRAPMLLTLLVALTEMPCPTVRATLVWLKDSVPDVTVEALV